MNLEIKEEERNLLLELIENAEKREIEGMAHAVSRTFKNVLRTRLDLLASVKEKIRSFGARAA